MKTKPKATKVIKDEIPKWGSDIPQWSCRDCGNSISRVEQFIGEGQCILCRRANRLMR